MKRCITLLSSLLMLTGCELLPLQQTTNQQGKPAQKKESKQKQTKVKIDPKLYAADNSLAKWYRMADGLTGIAAADELLISAQSKIDQGDYVAARHLLNRAYAIEPNSSVLMYQMATLDMYTAKHKQAKDKLARVNYLLKVKDAFIKSRPKLKSAIERQTKYAYDYW